MGCRASNSTFCTTKICVRKADVQFFFNFQGSLLHPNTSQEQISRVIPKTRTERCTHATAPSVRGLLGAYPTPMHSLVAMPPRRCFKLPSEGTLSCWSWRASPARTRSRYGQGWNARARLSMLPRPDDHPGPAGEDVSNPLPSVVGVKDDGWFVGWRLRWPFICQWRPCHHTT